MGNEIVHFANCNRYTLCGQCVHCLGIKHTPIRRIVNCVSCQRQLDSIDTNHGRKYYIILDNDTDVYTNDESALNQMKTIAPNSRFYVYNPGMMDYEPC